MLHGCFYMDKVPAVVCHFFSLADLLTVSFCHNRQSFSYAFPLNSVNLFLQGLMHTSIYLASEILKNRSREKKLKDELLVHENQLLGNAHKDSS